MLLIESCAKQQIKINDVSEKRASAQIPIVCTTTSDQSGGPGLENPQQYFLQFKEKPWPSLFRPNSCKGTQALLSLPMCRASTSI